MPRKNGRIYSGTGICLCIFLLAAVFVGCNARQKSGNHKYFSYAINTDITSLDPVRVTEDNPRKITSQIFETLVSYDENLTLTPMLSDSWQNTNNGKTWIFKLHANVFFQNDSCFKGHPRTVTAGDAVYSLTRLLDPKTQTLGAFILVDIVKGASDFYNGKSKAVSGIKAVDSITILFELTKPDNQFPVRLSVPFTAIVPEEAVSYYGNQWGSHPVGTGPFEFKSWDITTDEIFLERNASYWKECSTNLFGVRFLVLKSEATELTEFSQLKIDAFELSSPLANIVFDNNGNLTERFRGAQLIGKPTLTIHFAGFNYHNSLLQNRSLRLACNYAVDKKALTEQVLNRLAAPSNGSIPLSLLGQEDSDKYLQNLQKARQLLSASSYRGQTLKYLTDNSTESVATAEFLQNQLAAIGVKISIDKEPVSVWVDKLTKGEFDLAKIYFAYDYPSPDNGLSQFLASNFAPAGPNFLYYSNPEFDSLYINALQKNTLAEAAADFQRCNSIIKEDAPWIFLYDTKRILVCRKEITGLKINSLSFSLILNDVKM